MSDWQSWQNQPPTSGAATASLVLGICGLVVCPLVCSILALVAAATSAIAHSARRCVNAGARRATRIAAPSRAASTATTSQAAL